MSEPKTPDLNDYRAMMNELRAPDYLRARTLQAADQAYHQASESGPKARAATPRRTSQPLHGGTQALSVKRHRFGAWAAAACLAVAAGVGLLAFEPLSAAFNGDDVAPNDDGVFMKLGAPSFADMFGLSVAEAAEIGQSVELACDESGIMPAGSGGTTFRHQMNLTCTGQGITHLAYSIEGEGISFMALDWSEGTSHPDVSSPERFEVDYNDQNPEGLHREIVVNLASPAMLEIDARMMELSQKIHDMEEGEERSALEAQWDELNAHYIQLHNEFYRNPSSENDDMAWIVGKEIEAAQKLANATLSVTATFTDGSTATKRYRIAPVENFEQAIRAFFETSFTPNYDENDPQVTTPLFTIAEIA